MNKIPKRTMTLNLNARDMELIEAMAIETDMDKTAIVKQALRLFQIIHAREKFGHRFYFLDENGKKVTCINDMFPMVYKEPQA